jgi:glycosyltransferase involved in cell wall biosynthesis
MSLSVLLSVFENEKPEYLYLSLKSIYNDQIFKPIQIILVEDGFLPIELKLVIDEFQDLVGKKLIRVTNKKNMGLGYSLNKGLSHCTSRYVARMDTDDIALPDRFEKQLNFMLSNPKIDLSGSYATEIDEFGVEKSLRKMPCSDINIKEALWTNPFIHPTVIFKRESLVRIGGYDSSLRRRQDYELWFRCALENFKFANIEHPLILYRFTHSTHAKQSRATCLLQGQIGYNGATRLGLGKIKALLCYIPYIRSFFPERIQHIIYKLTKMVDPRNA